MIIVYSQQVLSVMVIMNLHKNNWKFPHDSFSQTVIDLCLAGF